MKILITGAQGFIGSRLAEALSREGHQLVCPSRHTRPPASPGHRASGVPADFTRMDDPLAWAPWLEGVECVINTVGIFRDATGADYTAVHVRAPVALFEAARQCGARVIQFSALGADAEARSDFHRSKRAADDALRALGMAAFIVQPSLVYGPGGTSAALFDRLAMVPVLPLPNGGRQRIQPVHIDDVVAGVLALLRTPAAGAVTIAFCGPRALGLRDYLAALRRGLGIAGRQHVVPLPAAVARAAARWGGPLSGGLLTPESLAMLERGNTADPSAFARLLGRPPIPPERFVDPAERDALRARALLANVVPLLRLSVALVWLWTAVVSLGWYPVADSLALLQRAGVPPPLAPLALYGAALLDLLFGLLTLAWRGRRARYLWLAQACLILAYTVVITLRLPEQWLHPFGPMSKNLPMLAVLALLYLHDCGPRARR